jgi:hypothetical protein
MTGTAPQDPSPDVAPGDSPHPSATGTRRWPGIARRLSAALVLGATFGPAPAPATAQFGAIEALARRVSDLSFYFSTGGLAAAGRHLDADAFGMTSFGVEMLLEVARVPSHQGRERVAATGSSTRYVLQRIEVHRSEGRVDTVYHYDVRTVSPGFRDSEILWTLELGIGYGQTEGLRLSDPGLDLTTTLRSLPAVSLYLSYEPIGTYLGVRTGLLRAQSLQVVDDSGGQYSGKAETFVMGALAGYAFAFNPTYLFVEGGYMVRNFPSVEWSGSGELLATLPRRLNASGWFLSAGIQFPIQ